MIFPILSPVRAALRLSEFDFGGGLDLTRSFYELDFVPQLPLPIYPRFPQADEIPVPLFLLFLLGMNYLSRS
jgi:hypothetical protein